jgi:hypothetical protein
MASLLLQVFRWINSYDAHYILPTKFRKRVINEHSVLVITLFLILIQATPGDLEAVGRQQNAAVGGAS